MSTDKRLENLLPFDLQEDPRTKIEKSSVAYNPCFSHKIPKDLQVPQAQLLILMRIRYANVVMNRDPFELELATHFKSIRALIERNMVVEQEKKFKILPKGLTVLYAYQLKQEFDTKKTAARISAKLTGEEDQTLIGHNQRPANTIPPEKEQRLCTLLFDLLNERGVDSIMRSIPEAETIPQAISLFILSKENSISAVANGVKIIKVTTKNIGAPTKSGFRNYTVELSCKYRTYGTVHTLEFSFRG